MFSTMLQMWMLAASVPTVSEQLLYGTSTANESLPKIVINNTTHTHTHHLAALFPVQPR